MLKNNNNVQINKLNGKLTQSRKKQMEDEKVKNFYQE